MIIIPIETSNYIMGRVHSAFVTTRRILRTHWYVTEELHARWQRPLKIVHSANRRMVKIQTAPGATIMSTTHHCLKTYYVRDQLGEIRPIVVKAYDVPGQKYDLLSVKWLNKCGCTVFHHPDPEESGLYAVISNKKDKAKCFPLMSVQVFFIRS